MFIICWVTQSRRSYWAAFDDRGDALKEYERLRAHPKIYTASMAGVIESTDYAPAMTA
jgi:hypothetical protein